MNPATTTAAPPPAPPVRRLDLRAPVLAPMLAGRTVSAFLAMAGVVQVLTAWAGVTPMACPVLQVTGLPCPGCGASRGGVALLRGDLAAMLHWHAMAPLLLLAVVVFALAALLPDPLRRRYVAAIDVAERRTFAVHLSLVVLVLYWLARLAYPAAQPAW